MDSSEEEWVLAFVHGVGGPLYSVAIVDAAIAELLKKSAIAEDRDEPDRGALSEWEWVAVTVRVQANRTDRSTCWANQKKEDNKEEQE